MHYFCTNNTIAINKPVYIQLADNLKKQIISGVYAVGDLIPSENELASLHNTTRSTVRQALSELLRHGYINKKKGKGSIVAQTRKRLGLLSFKGFTEVLGNDVNTKVLQGPRLQKWEYNFFSLLSDMEKDAGCIYLQRLRSVSGEAVMLETTYLPNLNLPRFTRIFKKKDSLFNTLLVSYQLEITNVEQDLRAVRADRVTSNLLDLKEGAPVLHINRKYLTNRENLNIYSSLYCNTDKYAISNVFD